MKTETPVRRDGVSRALLELGPATVARIADHLGLTASAVRKHLDALLASGEVSARDAPVRGPRGRGRPARLFALTDLGRSRFEAAYDDLAVGALRYLAAHAGAEAVTDFARARVGELETRYRTELERRGNTPEALALVLSADGYAATVRTTPAVGGVELCQHHCPVAHVAAEFPQLCEAETEAFARLLGTHVQRLATIAHGDVVCTTHVPGADVRTGTTSETTTTESTTTDTTTTEIRTPRTCT